MKLLSPSILAALLLGTSVNACAALGGTLESVQADSARLEVTDVISSSGTLTVHSLQRSPSAVVREFTDQSGKVVGVAWSGQGQPNLSQILGPAYFARLSEARTKGLTSHRVMVLHDQDFVFESQGSMRGGFVGHAYLTSAIAAGVTPEQFK